MISSRLPALAHERVHLKVDVLVAQSTPAAIAAQQASSTVPVVMVAVGDPLGAKLVDSLAIRAETSPIIRQAAPVGAQEDQIGA